MNIAPKLADLLEHPERVSALPLEAVPAMRGKLAELDTLLQMRVAQSNGQSHASAEGDRLLDVRQAAAKLNVSEGYLYRNHRKLHFIVHIGNKLLFSEAGIEKWIGQRTGSHKSY